jgi:DNA replication protein DnaC
VAAAADRLSTVREVFLDPLFNNDVVLTSALLDRLLHHAETVRIEGKSYRSMDQVEV